MVMVVATVVNQPSMSAYRNIRYQVMKQRIKMGTYEWCGVLAISFATISFMCFVSYGLQQVYIYTMRAIN